MLLTTLEFKALLIRHYQMRTIATDDPVARCVGLFVARLRCAYTTKEIKVLLGVQTVGG